VGSSRPLRVASWSCAAALRAGDVCISMGCGDIASLPDEVLERRARHQADRA